MNAIISPLVDNVDLKKERVGQAAYRLLQKPDDKQGVIDTQREMLKEYRDELIKAAKQVEWTDPFFVCVWTRRERTMVNVLRNQFFVRRTRPAPTYDMALYDYNPQTEQLRFVWCIPDRETVDYICANANSLPNDHAQLIEFCQKFKAGTLV